MATATVDLQIRATGDTQAAADQLLLIGLRRFVRTNARVLTGSEFSAEDVGNMTAEQLIPFGREAIRQYIAECITADAAQDAQRVMDESVRAAREAANTVAIDSVGV